MEIKKLGIGTDWSSYKELKGNHIASQGWSFNGDLSFMFGNQEELSNYIEIISDGMQSGKNAFKQIMTEIKKGDIILAFEGNSVKGIAEVPEKFVYYYDENIEFYRNCIFPINWIDWKDFCKDPNISKQGGQGVKGIENCANPPELVDYIHNYWETYKKDNNYNIQLDECNDKLQQLLNNLPNRREESKKNFIKLLNNEHNKHMITSISNLLRNNHNLILTGAPGTGKTYLAKQIAAQIILGKEYDEKTATDKEKKQMEEQCGFVQFHPSYDYTDFVEGLRPIEKNEKLGFERKDGVFKDFCKKATTNTGFSFDDAYDRLIQDIQSGDLRTIKLKTKDSAELEVRSGNNIGWYSETEEGNKSSNVVSKDRLKKLFDVYNTLQKLEELSNINEGVQSIIGGCDSTYYWGVLHHILENYVFLKPYVFIIDEINRGEISKIFGELFYSIDPGYRGEKGKVNTQYQNLIDKNGDDVFKDGFYVPKNVYIIGTMNDIDRSVESMDFAMRRRFAWKEITAESRQSMLEEDDAWGGSKPTQTIIDEIKIRMDNLNAAIIDNYDYGFELSPKDRIGLTMAYQIGAAYFLKYALYSNSEDPFEDLWTNHLKGLLYEYLRGTTNIEAKIERLQKAYNDTTVH